MRDPHHLPRWWPRVSGIESVADDAFTQVIKTRKGKIVRADFDIVRTDEAARTLVWEQQIEGTPFAGVLRSSETVLTLRSVPQDGPPDASRPVVATEVTIQMRLRLSRGWDPWLERANRMLPRPLSSHVVQRAAARTIDEALDGLERISV
jgi:hypothetical protein